MRARCFRRSRFAASCFFATSCCGGTPIDPTRSWAAQSQDEQGHDRVSAGLSEGVSRDGTRDGPAEGPFSGWSVVEAPDVETAMQLLADHPFIGRGGILQVSIPAALD